MSELSLPACPICFAKGSLFRQTMKRAEQDLVWYECRECGSVLLWMGHDKWVYQQVGRKDKQHLLKQPVTVADLEEALFRTEIDLAVNAVQQSPQAAAEQSEPAVGVCKRCGTKNPAGAIQCKECHFPLALVPESMQAESPQKDMASADTKTCPYCAETIKARAAVCRYCGRDLTSKPMSIPPKATRRPRWPWVAALIAVAILAVLFLVFRENISILPPRASDPAYVKDVAAYTEGSDGLVVYFVLADAAGQEIAAEGKVNLTIFNTDSEWNAARSEFVDTEERLLSVQLSLTASDFFKTEVGTGAFERTRLICSFGRIPYSRFSRLPQGHTGKVVVEFTPSGASKSMKGEDTVIW